MTGATGDVDWPQLAWDALGILGFDLDGDPTPAAVVDLPARFMRHIREMRDDYDEALEAIQTLDERAQMQADAWDEGFAAADYDFESAAIYATTPNPYRRQAQGGTRR